MRHNSPLTCRNLKIEKSFGSCLPARTVQSDVNRYSSQMHYLFSKRQILDSSKLKEFADSNFEFDENGRKLSKRVENTVGKGEIARNEQFLLYRQLYVIKRLMT